MADKRKHCGPHPRDAALFNGDAVDRLRDAAFDLAWLLQRGYAEPSSLKIVGDRYKLVERQRTAIRRAVCTATQRERRATHEVPASLLREKVVWIDGFNLLVTLEAILGRAVILKSFDGCYRDLASMHGTYRKMEDTLQAIELAGECLEHLAVAGCRWLLDKPVSNSGRLKTMLREVAATQGWNWEVELVADPDPLLVAAGDAIVITADSMILDHCEAWLNLTREILSRKALDAWIVDVSDNDRI